MQENANAFSARDEPSAVKLTEAAVAVVTGSVVVLCGSKDIVVLPPSPPSTVEAEALALACDVLNACVVAFVVSPEKFESAKREQLLLLYTRNKEKKQQKQLSK